MDRQFKRPSDGEPPEGAKRHRVEEHTSGGFALGEAGRRSTRFIPIAQPQEQHERHENTSLGQGPAERRSSARSGAESEHAGSSENSKSKRGEDIAPSRLTLDLMELYDSFFSKNTLVSPQSQELHERRESTSFEVPVSQQVGIEYLFGLRNQVQDTRNWSQAVLEGLDQQIAKIQQRAGSSEVSVSGSHSGYHQQDTRLLENSFHPPVRDEQSMLQHQQVEVDDYLIASPSDPDHESSNRDLLEAHGPAGSIPARSSIDRDAGLYDANSPSDAQSRRAAGRAERFPQLTDARRQETVKLRPGSLQQRRELSPSREGEKRQSDANIDSRETGQINYCSYDGFRIPVEENHLMGTTNFLTSQEYQNYQSGIKKRSDKRTPKEDLAVRIHHKIENEMVSFILRGIQRGKFSMRPHEREKFVLNFYNGNQFLSEIKELKDYLKIARQDPRYKDIYGSEEENWQPDQTMTEAHAFSPFEAQKAGPSRQAFDHLGVDLSVEFREHPDQTQGTSSQSIPEIQPSFAAHHPAETSRSQQADVREQDQIEQIQNALMQQHEAHDQADQCDHLKRNAEEMMQIQKSYREHKQMQGHAKNENLAQSFLDRLPDKYRQELMVYCTTGIGSHDVKQIYRRWHELYRGI